MNYRSSDNIGIFVVQKVFYFLILHPDWKCPVYLQKNWTNNHWAFYSITNISAFCAKARDFNYNERVFFSKNWGFDSVFGKRRRRSSLSFSIVHAKKFNFFVILPGCGLYKVGWRNLKQTFLCGCWMLIDC